MADDVSTDESTGGSDDTGLGDSGTTDDSDDSDDTGTSTGDDDGPLDWPSVPCAEGNDAIWVLGRAAAGGAPELHTFDPDTATWQFRAELSCLDDASLNAPMSLAVGRDGTGYLSGVDEGGDLLTLPLLDEDPCEGLQTEPWTVPGGYATLAFRSQDAFDPDTERLFAHGPGDVFEGWLGEVFLFAEGNPVAILDYANVEQSGLAGTGDGQLFGVAFNGELLQIEGIFWGGGSVSGSPQLVGRPFAAWGGAIYVVENGSAQGQGGAGIFRFALDGTAAYDLVVPWQDIPVEVAAFTASTCAPTVFGG